MAFLLPISFEVDIDNTVSMFHSYLENDISSEKLFHIDTTIIGGVVYLNNVHPQNPENHGTMILHNDKSYVVPYQYNRLVLYPSNYVHRPMHGFGKTLDDSRLTLSFFIK